ncbi:alpha/beta fold hydrolase [Pacificimonas flava]|nr:alpha/beta fold hydrolase [Pacificimonas flava]MBB5280346.1 dienelactone hydrolase [Pacificimonas flava]
MARTLGKTQTLTLSRGIAFIAALVCGSAELVSAEPIAEAFGTMPTADDMRLSPDGTHIAYLNRSGTYDVLFVADVDSGESVPILRSNASSSFSNCRFLNTERLACLAYGSAEIARSLHTATASTIALNVDGSDLIRLGRQGSGRDLYGTSVSGTIVDPLPNDADHVLMSVYLVPQSTADTRIAKREEGPSVQKVNVYTNRMSTEFGPVTDARQFFTDTKGEVRAYSILYSAPDGYTGNRRVFRVRPAGSRDWRLLGEDNVSDYDRISIEGFSEDGTSVFMLKPHEGRSALFSVPVTANGPETLVWSRDGVDADSLVTFGQERRPVGVAWSDEYNHIDFFDPELEALSKALASALGGDVEVSLIESSADGNRILLTVSSADKPGHYYVYDKSARKLIDLAPARGSIDTRALATTTPISYETEDGTSVPAYLTIPPGKTRDSKNLPFIVLPHGGPTARDYWGFDWLAQYLAAKGYAVLQPNYRGSAGYGADWLGENAFRSWKLAVSDINGAAYWAQEAGLADPERTAIVGWSYGGYAALQANVIDPDLFRATIAIAPVVDLEMLKQDESYYAGARLVANMIGSGDWVAAGSPRRYADRFENPVLLVHGTEDANVRVRHSHTMRNALQSASKPVEYLEFEGLDHQLASSKSRIEMLEKIGLFLANSLDRQTELTASGN